VGNIVFKPWFPDTRKKGYDDMDMRASYYDKRSEFWKKYWDQAVRYEDFVKTAKPEEAVIWKEREGRTPELTEEQKTRLRGYNRELNLLMYATSWCGDCSRQAPMLKKVVEAAGEKVRLKLIDRETSKELQDELRIVGALRIPIVVFLTEDFWEVGRFGERLLNMYRSKAAREIGRGKDLGVLSTSALTREMADWLDVFERMLIMVRLSPPLRKRHND
jgi:thiol-disulfide isomerase/thioredoxin